MPLNRTEAHASILNDLRSYLDCEAKFVADPTLAEVATELRARLERGESLIAPLPEKPSAQI